MRCCGDGVFLTAQPRMPFPSEHHFKSLSAHGFHRVVYRQWGDLENARVVVCVHGLTRNGRDFDSLAAAISDRYRVICPDMPGRGDSAAYLPLFPADLLR